MGEEISEIIGTLKRYGFYQRVVPGMSVGTFYMEIKEDRTSHYLRVNYPHLSNNYNNSLQLRLNKFLNPNVKLKIRGTLNEDIFEYEGHGLIKILDEE